MAIGQLGTPYVHSNYYNFLNNSQSNPYGQLQNDSTTPLSETIAELEGIRTALKAQADAFLKGKTPQQLYNDLISKNPFTDVAKKVILSPKAQAYLSGEGGSYNKTEVAKILGPEVANLLIPEIRGAIAENDFVEAIARSIFGTKEIRLVNQKTNINTSIKNKEMEKYLIDKIKQPFRSSESKILKQLVKDALKETGVKKSNSKQSNIDNFISYFRREVTREVMNSSIPFQGDLTTTLNEYLNAMENFFRKGGLKDNYTSKQASGAIAEVGMAKVLTTATDSELQIRIIGDTPEKEVQQSLGEILSVSEGVIKRNDKQSYSDWLMTYKGDTVRVQSKNYRDAIRNFINVDGIATGGGAQISILRDQTFEKLMDELQNSGNKISFNRQEIEYTVANEFWFDMKGGINRGQSGTEKHAFNDQVLMSSLSSAVINYLGIVIDKKTVINPRHSNIFYFIFGDGLVPTYEIIDGMILALKGKRAELANIKFTRDKGSVPKLESAESLYGRKSAAVGKLIPNGGYKDSELVGVGSSVGATIVKNLSFRSINIQIDAETLYKSAYVFTKK